MNPNQQPKPLSQTISWEKLIFNKHVLAFFFLNTLPNTNMEPRYDGLED